MHELGTRSGYDRNYIFFLHRKLDVADFVQGSFFVFRSRFSEIFREIRYFVVDLNRILFNVKIESSIDYDIL